MQLSGSTSDSSTGGWFSVYDGEGYGVEGCAFYGGEGFCKDLLVVLSDVSYARG